VVRYYVRGFGAKDLTPDRLCDPQRQGPCPTPGAVRVSVAEALDTGSAADHGCGQPVGVRGGPPPMRCVTNAPRASAPERAYGVRVATDGLHVEPDDAEQAAVLAITEVLA